MQPSDQYAALQARLSALLATRVDDDELTFDPELTALYASDIFYSGRLPAAILRPSSIASMARAVGATTAAGIPVAPRGGGLSYSSGYVSPDHHMLLIDTRRLTGISDVNAQSSSVTVEAGCTWAALREVLAPLGLRTPFWGPASGRDATIGATLSQNAVLFGSGLHGAAGDNVIEMTVVLSDGSLHRINAAQSPDELRAFVGDGGALGIKAEITLPVEPLPVAVTYAACKFAMASDAIRAMSQIGQSRLASECFLYGQTFADRNRPAASDKALYVEQVPGFRHHADSPLELHAAMEGSSSGEAAERRAQLIDACLANGGTALGDGLLGHLRENPFGPPNLMLGPEGRRWVPIHFIVPHARQADMLGAINACMIDHRDEIARHDITWSWSSLPVGRDHVLIEPALYWKDDITPLMRAMFAPEQLEARPAHAAAPSARAAVAGLRQALIEAGRPVGAAHMQPGRVYPPEARFQPPERGTFERLKQTLDPKGMMNPGVLGGA